MRISSSSIGLLAITSAIVMPLDSANAFADGCLTWNANVTPPGGGAVYEMVYDSARGVTVLFRAGETWEWNGTFWALRATTGPAARWEHAMAYDSGRGVTVLFGGNNGSVLKDIWEWDGTEWELRTPTTGPGHRTGHVMAYDAARGVTVMFGGTNEFGLNAIGWTWEWDGTSWSLRLTSVIPSCQAHSMVYDSARRVTVLFAGCGDSPALTAHTWEWDGATWLLRSTAGPSAYSSRSMAYDSVRGKVVLFGGRYAQDAHTWEWDGTNWSEYDVPGPPPRENHAMAYDAARGATVLYGGSPYDYNDTWEWDGVSWTERNKLSPRSTLPGHALAYDQNRGVTVLFGGQAIHAEQNETWEWNGNQWAFRGTGGPAPRRDHAMAYDSARGVTVLFGGIGDLKFGDTWEWNGVAWTLRAETGPAPSREHTMAYDSARGVTVLFGGLAFDGTDWIISGETWEWDGTSWSLLAVAGPPPRSDHAMTFDNARGVTVLNGGRDDDVYFGDTWEWDGVSWAFRGDSEPSTRAFHVMASDSARGVSLLIGGSAYDNGQIIRDDVWEWDGNSWTESASVDASSWNHGSKMVYDSARQAMVMFGPRGGALWERVSDETLAPTLTGDDVVTTKNRYLTIEARHPDRESAIRVLPAHLPTGFEAFQDVPMWISEPREAWELCPETWGGYCNTWTATLSCQPDYQKWGSFGPIDVSHEIITPDARFSVQAVYRGCDASNETLFSSPLSVSTATWGDVVGPFDSSTGMWTPPDGRVDVPFDVIAIVDRFAGRPGAPRKARVDLYPSTPNHSVSVQDLSAALDAFRGMKYPFLPTAPPCGG